MSSKVPALIISERDAVMYEMKKAGATYQRIAKHFDISESTAFRGVQRMQERVANRMALDHAAEARMDIERMDDLLRAVIPLTRPTKMTTPDGEEVTIPPSLDAVDRVLKIIGQRAKFFGYDKGESLTVNVTTGTGGPSTAAVDTKSTETTPEEEVMSLLGVFKDAAVLDPEAVEAVMSMLKANGVDGAEDILDAEVVEDVDPMVAYDPVAIDPARSTPPSEEPPEVLDDYDEEFPDG